MIVSNHFINLMNIWKYVLLRKKEKKAAAEPNGP